MPHSRPSWFSPCSMVSAYAPCVTQHPPAVAHHVDSEVSRLRTVMLHRPGPELARLTPRNNDSLLFDGIPWVGRAQDEHDAFAQALRDHGVEVLYLVELLIETLANPEARKEIIESTNATLH